MVLSSLPPTPKGGLLQGVGLPEQGGAGSIPSWGKGVFLYLSTWGQCTARRIRCHLESLPSPASLRAREQVRPGRRSGQQALWEESGLSPGPETDFSSLCGTEGPRATQTEQGPKSSPSPSGDDSNDPQGGIALGHLQNLSLKCFDKQRIHWVLTLCQACAEHLMWVLWCKPHFRDPHLTDGDFEVRGGRVERGVFRLIQSTTGRSGPNPCA